MSSGLLVVSVSALIERPVDVVRRHFSDVEHHVRNPVHPDVLFTPVADTGDEQRFRKTIRILGVPVVDEVILRRQADGSITEDSVSGPNVGMRLVSRFRTDGPERTFTTLTVEMPVPGVRRIAAPLFRRFLQGRLSKALDEDRRDLEGGHYPP